MSRLELPLVDRRLQTTGDALWRAEVVLDLKTDRGPWRDVRFVVDTGTEMTTMPAARARAFGLPIPRRPVSGLTLGGQEVRAGLLRVRVVGLDATESVFPCDFIGDPDTPPPAAAEDLPGLSGVIDQLRLIFDGTPAMGAPFGRLIVETP